MKNGWLITGGTGFLGRALVRRLLGQVDRICIYSRGEAAQAAMRAELNDDPRLRWFIGDVRDVRRLRWAMESVEIVVHAAALKRVEVGEYNPTEMVQTNILGSMNVIDAAIDAGVGCVVFVSTDKAVEPVNCYGATKLVAEKLFLGAAQLAPPPLGPKFVVVRYGNVAGSTGSVIPTWRAAFEQGKPIQIRNPDATRFWLTVDGAVAIILQASREPTGACIVPILPAYRVGDLAQAILPHESESPCFEFLPLRAGEKMHESLLGFDERSGPRRSCDARRMTVEELRKELTRI